MHDPGPRDDRESCADASPPSPAAQTAGPSTAETEQAQFRRRLRRGAARGWPIAIGVGALLLCALVAAVVLRPKRAGRAFGAVANLPEATEQETPEWLDDSRIEDEEGGRGRRHKDEAGQMGRPDSQRRTYSRYGLEGPDENEDPHMAREEARSAAQNAGIIGVLKASTGAWNAPSDPTSALGGLMGDQTGENFGFGGLGLRGTGRGSGSGYGRGEGAIGRGEGAEVARHARWRTANAMGTPAPAAPPVAEDSPAIALPAPDASLASSTAPPAARATPRPLELPAQGGVQALLAHYGALEGVHFQPANGYFANTYLPGDAGMRGMLARLSDYDRARLPQAAQGAQLERGARRNHQPFDAPSHAALDVFLSASERGAVRERRLQLQVGLRATPRLAGRRPALNAAIVLDLHTAIDADTANRLRALLAALAAAHEPGDRFALWSAGRGAARAAGPDSFRHGALALVAQRLLATAPASGGASLPDALRAAQSELRGSDDPQAPLGSSTLIVITPGLLDAQLPELTALAQQSATLGIPLSVFDIGSRHADEALSRLAFAGQGSLRRVGSAGEAAAVVDRELSSVSRIVARALRLRIRLAPGVRLVEVLGAERLGEPSAQRVREAEQSIDRRLSRNLGIARDRGEDEEGVQIVIPSFEAGDTHVVLLDVVVPGPGPVADVSVRYKDLVRLDNGVVRGSLALPNRELPRGALELNVLKNVIAQQLSRQLLLAGAALDAGASGRARGLLDAAIALLTELEHGAYGLARDRELLADQALLEGYRALVSELSGDEQRRFAAESLHVASLLKVQPRPSR